jgi:hypothetical protein
VSADLPTWPVRLSDRFLSHLDGTGAWQAVQHRSPDPAAEGIDPEDVVLFTKILDAKPRADRSVTVRVTAPEAAALHLHAEVLVAGAVDNLPDPDALADLNAGRAAARAMNKILDAAL